MDVGRRFFHNLGEHRKTANGFYLCTNRLLEVKQLYWILEYSLGFFKNNRTRNKSEYSFIHGACIYHRYLQFQSSSRQILMCILCCEHLFPSRESPNDPPTNIPEKNDCHLVQSGLYHAILRPLVCSFWEMKNTRIFDRRKSEYILELGKSVPTFTPIVYTWLSSISWYYILSNITDEI